ncbi:MAG: hypothetical protein RLZZ31_394 [Actinomycetota bacterium]
MAEQTPTQPTSTPPVDGPVWAIVLAAGAGRRFGPSPKQFEVLDGDRVVDRSLSIARSAADHVVVVLANGEEREGDALVADGLADVWVYGGEERADSVRAGLSVIDDSAAVIVVHDAARPLASAELHRNVVRAIRDGADAAIPAVAVTDTIKKITHDERGRMVVTETPMRHELVAVQTPQAFRADILRQAHSGNASATDDAALVELIGGVVVVIEGERTNIKITSPEDLAIAAVLLSDLG